MLTVECASSIWAQELTYLGGEMLVRMTELDPAHPVKRLRFMTRRSPAADGDEPPAMATAAPQPADPPPRGGPRPSPAAPFAGSPPQDRGAPASNRSRRGGTTHRADVDAAQQGARQVGDERLREAIVAALGAAAAEPPEGSPGGPSVNQKK